MLTAVRGATTRLRLLESDGNFWDNRCAVTKFLSALFVSATLLSATACQKPTDTGRVQEEALAMVKVHATTIEQLQRRADSALTRGRTLGNGAPGIADAGRRLTEARAQLDQLKGLTSSAPTVISSAAKTGNVEEMNKVIDGLTEKLEDGSAAARADITAVESWLASVEGGRPPASAAAPVTEPHTGTPQGGAGSGAGAQTGGANAPADGTVPPGTSKPTSPGDLAPSGTQPATGAAPTGTAPAKGTAPTGTAPTGTAPAKPATTGTAPAKPAPTGTAPAKPAPAGTAPAKPATGG